MRFTVDDHPGVLAQITSVLGRHNISIASVIQHEPNDSGATSTVPLVIMTHTAPEGSADAAMSEIGSIKAVHGESVRMRVLD